MLKKAKKLLICLLLVMVSACSSKPASTAPNQTSAATNVADDSFNIVITAAPVGFHPLKTNDSASTYVSSQIYETLYIRGLDGVTFEPLLAKGMPECDETGLACTIKLQENVTFHDGTPFTAEAVKYTLESIKNKDYGSARASISASIEEVEVVDDTTVVLHLTYPDGVLVAKLAHTNAAIVSEASDTAQDLNVNPVGTGPYKFVSAVSGSEVTLTRYDEYWGETPDIKDVTYSVISDVSTALARLETKEADLMVQVPATSYDRANAISGYTTVASESSAITYLAFRNNSSANSGIANKDLREAIIKSIDINAYIDSVLGGLAHHSQSIIGPTVLGYTENQENFGYTYNLEEAQKIIKDGGYEDEPIKFLINNRSATVSLAEFIQASLQAAGLNNVTIVQEEWATFLASAKEDNAYDISILTWANVTGDGSELLDPNFTIANGSGRVRYENEEFDKLVDLSKKTLDKEERISYLEKAAELIENDAVVAPLYNTYEIYTYNSGYENVMLDAGGIFNVKNFKIVE